MSWWRRVMVDRHGHNWVLLGRFALVGATGVVVNLVTLRLVELLGPSYTRILIDLPITDYNVRWYHLYTALAFLVANLWNFQLNRTWAFRSAVHARPWLSEYLPFLSVGLLALGLNLMIVTLLIHPGSPVALPTSMLDDSSTLRSRLLWANLISVTLITPVSFITNKFWAFRAVRAARRAATSGAQPSR
jgi:putative flippase GtrA